MNFKIWRGNNNLLTFDLCVMIFVRVKVIASIYRFCFATNYQWSSECTRKQCFMNRNWYARMLLSFGHCWKSFFLNLIDFYRYYENIPFEIVHTIAAAAAIATVSIASHTLDCLFSDNGGFYSHSTNWKMSKFCSNNHWIWHWTGTIYPNTCEKNLLETCNKLIKLFFV